MFERGYLKLGRLGGVPVLLHWSAPIGAYAFSGFQFSGVLFACFAGLVLIHEGGHALMARAMGARPTAVEITGFGGLCRWEGEVSPIGRAVIAFGGVWAQLALLVVAEAYLRTSSDWLHSVVGLDLAWAATASNAWMIALNLLPFPPLDGAEAWRLPYLLGIAARQRLFSSRAVAPALLGDDPLEDEAAFVATGHAEAARKLASELLRQAAEKEEP